MNILVIEDNTAMAESIRRTLGKLDIVGKVDVVNSFFDAYNSIVSFNYDITLVDIDLGDPNNTGVDLCKIFKKYNDQMIVIMVTGMKELDYMKTSFASGADDYIQKPFSHKELQLRVERWRCLENTKSAQKPLRYRGLSYIQTQDKFYYKNNAIPLGKRSKELLLEFIKTPETLISTDELGRKLWGDDYMYEKKKNIREGIRIVKNTLSEYGNLFIQNIHGQGYLLTKDEG